MLCEQCQDTEASVHYVQVADGMVQKLHLCATCAEEKGSAFEPAPTLGELVEDLSGSMPAVKECSCPTCHMRLSDFRNTRRFGCPDCYDTFSAERDELLAELHDSRQHRGKVPLVETPAVRLEQARQHRAGLVNRLALAVAEERYEEAAALRDELGTELARRGGTS